MRVSHININNQISSKAVIPKYYEWAQKEAKGVKRFGELFTQLKMEVYWKDIHPQDAIDTLYEIKKILPNPRTDFDRTLEFVKEHLNLMKK